MVKESNLINSITSELLKLLSGRITVDKIVLFGSYATGNFKPTSDIDYIITSKEFRNKNIFEIADLTRNIEHQLIKLFPIPFDLLYYSDTDWLQNNSVTINEAKKHGILLYSSDSN